MRPSRRKPPHRIIIARGDNVRGFTVRPWVAATLTLTGIVFTCLYVLATGYLVFRDDLLAASLARTARQQQAYEDRIATLRSEIDRLTSRQLLNQEAFEAKLAHLVGKQAALDARQDIIAGLSQAA
ncbi:MAG: M23 family peptidase, partial [Bauldia sp.]|nr:M23 family peptidase [Bauldia sp.]